MSEGSPVIGNDPWLGGVDHYSHLFRVWCPRPEDRPLAGEWGRLPVHRWEECLLASAEWFRSLQH